MPVGDTFAVGDEVLIGGQHKIIANKVCKCTVARIQDFIEGNTKKILYIVEWQDEHGKIQGEAYEAGQLHHA